jgi:hypothetical protein
LAKPDVGKETKDKTPHVIPGTQADCTLTLLKMVPAATRSVSTDEPHSLREYNKHLSAPKPKITLKFKDKMNV